MDENVVSSLTINGDKRDIADAQSRDDIALLKAQIAYMAEILDIDLSGVIPQAAN